MEQETILFPLCGEMQLSLFRCSSSDLIPTSANLAKRWVKQSQ